MLAPLKSELRETTTGVPPEEEFHQRGLDIFYTKQSLVEETLAKYSPGGGAGPRSSFQLSTRIRQDECAYPYNPLDLAYLSKFRYGIKGCFKCGSTDHYQRYQYPLGSVDDKNTMDKFYKELPILKPQFREKHENFIIIYAVSIDWMENQINSRRINFICLF